MVLDIKSNGCYYVYGYVMTYEVRNVTFYNMPNQCFEYDRLDKIYYTHEIYFAKKTDINVTQAHCVEK